MSCFTFGSLFSNSICLVSTPGQNMEVEQPVLPSHVLLFQLTLFPSVFTAHSLLYVWLKTNVKCDHMFLHIMC